MGANAAVFGPSKKSFFLLLFLRSYKSKDGIPDGPIILPEAFYDLWGVLAVGVITSTGIDLNKRIGFRENV